MVHQLVVSLSTAQALLRIAASDSTEARQREREIGFCVLYHLSSSSVAVLHMTSLKGQLYTHTHTHIHAHVYKAHA